MSWLKNSKRKKALKGQIGEVDAVAVKFIKKGQTRLNEFDDQILAIYSRGMTTRDIAATSK